MSNKISPAISDDSRKFALVVFETGTHSLVSSSWLIGVDQCYWPSSGDVRKLAKKHAGVDESWVVYPCRIISTSDTFDRIREKEILAADTDNVDTCVDDADETSGRKKRITKRPSHLRNDDSVEESTPVRSNSKKSKVDKSVEPGVPIPPVLYKDGVDRSQPAASQAPAEKHLSTETAPEQDLGHSLTRQLDELVSAGTGSQTSPVVGTGLLKNRVSDFPKTPVSNGPTSFQKSTSERTQNAVINGRACDYRTPPSKLRGPPSNLRTASTGTRPGPPKSSSSIGGSSIDAGEFQSTVLQLLIKMRAEINELKQQLEQNTTILQGMQQGESDNHELDMPDNIELPMKSDDHMDAMEDALQDGSFRKRLICKLATLGGKNLADVVGGILRFLMTVDLQRRYNWCGLKKKKKFGNLKIASVVCRAVRRNNKFSSVTDDDIRQRCASFFTNSRDRRLTKEDENESTQRSFSSSSESDSD